jgi:Dolichyl-phosphate-mannose-protein mannosyltransferase
MTETKRRERRWTLALAVLLGGALGLRLWGVRQGLPYVYNVDEASNFVPTAVGFYFADSWNPHYFVNPPAFSYLLHAVFATWFGGDRPFSSEREVADAYATDPAAAFALARVTAAVLGTAAVGFLYLTGARLYDRRAGLVAGAVMAVSFLAIFYSHLALNDVPALLPLVVSVYGSAGVLVHGRRRDYAIAGAALGLAAATKYTAGIALLPLAVAIAARAFGTPAARRGLIGGAALAAALALAAFLVANPHALLSFDEFWDDVRRQKQAASGFGKLGLGYDSGIAYYLWALTWGLGWLPLAAAAVGAVVAFKGDRWLGLMLVPWPILFTLFMGMQDRYFGRWLLPAFPALALLAGVGAVWLADRLRTPRARAGALAALTAALVAQGLVFAVHVDRVLSRDDTRNAVRDWMVANVPAGSKIVVEPIVPDAWFTDVGGRDTLEAAVREGATPSGRRWNKFPTGRTRFDPARPEHRGRPRFVSVENYERTLRPALVGFYERGGYCWVVIGSTQYGRALVDRDQVPDAIAYYRELARRARLVYRASPYRSGEGPVEFNFDWSFDYFPRAYARPGPTVLVYRLHGGRCAGLAAGRSAVRQ